MVAKSDDMYTVTVSRELPAQHVLTVPDPGPEGDPHTHCYEIVVRLSGDSLDEYGYLVNIDHVEAALDTLEDRYRDAMLNDLAEFEGNPSVERFARNVCERLRDELDAPNVTRLQVTIWETDDAAGTYEWTD